MAFKIRDLVVLLAVAFIAAACADDVELPQPDVTPPPQTSEIVVQGDIVSVDYTGTFPNGSVFDSSSEMGPIQVQVGSGMTIPGFEAQLLGMEVGENKQFTLPPEEAYGEYDENLIVVESVPAENFGEDMNQYVGENIVVQTETGMPLQAYVIGVEDEMVTLEIDQNHPLAGETLVFDVTVRSIDELPGMPQLPDPNTPFE